jgi:aa3 type cytochrome c oxidase subunit IV
MADHGGAVEIGNTTGDDYAAHLNTYESFVGLAKYGTVALVILLILMAFFLL